MGLKTYTPNPRFTLESLTYLLARRHPDNPKTHDLNVIPASIRRFGFGSAVVINDRTELLAVGHGRVDALALMRDADEPTPRGIDAREDGEWLVPALHVDLDPDEARAFMVADNQSTIAGGWDDVHLADLLDSIRDSTGGLTGVGFTVGDVQAMIDELRRENRPPPDPEAIPDISRAIRFRPGDLVRMGESRLLCGDATVLADIERLASGALAQCLWTDPPYGVSYTGRTRDRLTIANDGADDLGPLLASAFAAADAVLAAGSALYIAHPAGPLSVTVAAAFLGQGWELRQSLVWMKDSLVVGHSDYQYRHEPIHYGFKPASGRLGRGAKGWYGGNDQASVFEVPRPRASREHPTAKPVALIATMLRNSTRQGDTVLDPFLGSGSTIIACEQLGRRCLGMEIEPRYVEVAVARWERFTGGTAEVEPCPR